MQDGNVVPDTAIAHAAIFFGRFVVTDQDQLAVGQNCEVGQGDIAIERVAKEGDDMALNGRLPDGFDDFLM